MNQSQLPWEPAHDFIVYEMIVYPTERPEEARYLDVPPQEIKLEAIRGALHDPRR